MPVLITITAISYLFLGGGSSASFLAPSALRKKLESLPEGSTRDEALAVADQIDALARAYDQATERATTTYAEDVVDHASSADSLIALLKRHDDERSEVLRRLVRLRQEMLEGLSEKEWRKVFNG